MNTWTKAPTTMSNSYFTELLNTQWTKKEWDGPLQYEDASVSHRLMSVSLQHPL